METESIPALYWTFGGDIMLRGDDENILLTIRFTDDFKSLDENKKIDILLELMPILETIRSNQLTSSDREGE